MTVVEKIEKIVDYVKNHKDTHNGSNPYVATMNLGSVHISIGDGGYSVKVKSLNPTLELWIQYSDYHSPAYSFSYGSEIELDRLIEQIDDVKTLKWYAGCNSQIVPMWIMRYFRATSTERALEMFQQWIKNNVDADQRYYVTPQIVPVKERA